MIVDWFSHFFGLDNLSGPWYGFWSGIGSDLSEVVLIAGLYTFLRRSNCHVTGCWRLGLHHVKGTQHVVCRRHHPADQLTSEDVIADHHEANA